MSTIPASAIVAVTPNVLAAGGSSLDLIGLLLTGSTRVPIGAVQPFSSAADVGEYFGASSDEHALAEIYFDGFTDSNVKPGSVLFTQYPMSAVSAYIRGGDVSGLTVVELQALNGFFSILINGVAKSATLNLATATSLSNAASIIGSQLGIEGTQAAVVTGSIAGNVLTVSDVTSGSLSVGDVLNGTGVAANTYIAALGTGTGAVGTYTISGSQNIPGQTITAFAPAVTYDSVSGAFIIVSDTTGVNSTMAYGSGAMATSLMLTQVTGAVLSQGAAAAAPGAFMDAIVAQTTNWATFMTIFDPDASGNDNKFAFAEWTDDQNNRYAYAAWDTDLSPSVTVPATSSLGYRIQQAGLSGICLIGQDTLGTDLVEIAAFVCGYAASLDFEETNGRATLAFRTQGGLTATCTDQSKSDNLAANGYNWFGAYATANEDFIFFYPGLVSGEFLWMDSYVNEIQLNNAFQLALMQLLLAQKSIPYNAAGYALIEAAMADPINAGLNFGTFRAGVTLSAQQTSQVNSDAGAIISTTLNQRGWYLQILDASPAVRVARGSPPMTFWYMDGQSVQKINLTSVELQ